MSNTGNDNVIPALDKAKEELDEAITNVARSAQELVDSKSDECGATGNYIVGYSEFEDLKQALKLWNDATQNFLRKIVKADG